MDDKELIDRVIDRLDLEVKQMEEKPAEEKDPLVYAFWKYDKFPYVLGDQGRLLPNGSFRPFGYGGATWNRGSIVAIYPIKLGSEIARKLKELKAVHEETVRTMSEQSMIKAMNILPELRWIV